MLGNTFKLLRIFNNIRITEVSLLTGISPMDIIDIENNERKISNDEIKKLKKILKRYNISMGEVYKLEEWQRINNLSDDVVLMQLLKYYNNMHLKNHNHNIDASKKSKKKFYSKKKQSKTQY